MVGGRGSSPRSGASCTWACHNHGCAHAPLLPAILSGDGGLFGGTIRALYRAGGLLSRDRATGYGAANLLFFCGLWPGAMYALAVVALRQRLVLSRLSSREERR